MNQPEFINTIFQRLGTVELIKLGDCNATLRHSSYIYRVSWNDKWIVTGQDTPNEHYAEFIRRVLSGESRDEEGNTLKAIPS